MKLQLDNQRDLLYVLFGDDSSKSSNTVTISPGVHADFDQSGQLIGIEVLEASRLIGKGIEFSFPSVQSQLEAA